MAVAAVSVNVKDKVQTTAGTGLTTHLLARAERSCCRT